MQDSRTIPLLVAAVLAALALAGVMLLGRGNSGDEATAGDDGDPSAAAPLAARRETRPGGVDDAARTSATPGGTGAAAAERPAGGTMAPDRPGTGVAGDTGHTPPPSAGDWQGVDPGAYPMAVKGAGMGIATGMDRGWSPEQEARQWFEPMDTALRAARPLTAEVYRTILSEHRDTATDVLKRAGEIADLRGPDAGMAFLDEYNGLIEPYREQAHGGQTP